MARRIVGVLLVLFVISLFVQAAFCDSYFHYKTYNREVNVYSDGSYEVFETIEILGMNDGTAYVELGSNFVVKSVKISSDSGKTWKTIGESNYIEGNVLKHTVLKDKNYMIQVRGEGVGVLSSFSSSVPSGVDQVFVKVNFRFDDVFMSAVSPVPMRKVENSVEWRFMDKYAKTMSVSFGTVNNDAKVDAACDALVLAGSLNKVKLFCDVSADELMNHLEISVPQGLEFSSFDDEGFEVVSSSPLVIDVNTPANSFRISNMEFVMSQDAFASMPVFKNAGIMDYNVALYSSESYKIDNVESTFTRINKYEADFLSRISGYVPSAYNLDSLYTGKSGGSLSFDKEKLKEKEHLATNINSVNFDVFPTKRGFAIVKANYQVVNTETGKYLEIDLPDNSVFWGAIVNSEPEKAYGEDSVVQVPLPVSSKRGNNYQAIRVTLLYVVTSDVFSDDIYSQYTLVLPMHKAPITNMNVKIGLSESFIYWKSDVVPEMDAQVVTYTPRRVYYDKMINFDAIGSAQKAMAVQVEQMSMDAPVQRVQLSMHGTPVTVQIPEMKKYLQVTGGGESIIMPEEAVRITIYGFEEKGMYVIYTLIGIVLLLVIIRKRKKIKKLIW
ncbi:MAG: hypothetical protein DRN71_03005 [Candidatus Nanohalarchaeota archaeon]|nr:MAG: hypothetical protein DRN71_03005 [Candidatus Nanohaloarchaeota archaeon]